MPNVFQNPITKEFFSLIENARTLAIRHHKRAFAADVVKASRLYLRSKNVDYSNELFDDLIVSLKDKNPNELGDKFDVVLKHVVSSIMAGRKQHDRFAK